MPPFRPLYHGSNIDDIFFGAVFVVMVAVFLYFYFSDPGEREDDSELEE